MLKTLFLFFTLMTIFSNISYAIEPPNNKLAELISKANRGDAKAQNNLGAMYCSAQGDDEDCREAAKWYHKAAEKGNTLAQSNLGGMYATGKGVLKDYITAYKWFNIAASKNNAHATKARNAIEKFMTPKQISEGQRLSKEWVAKSWLLRSNR